ncbi:hypothetical protein GW755_00225 [bacterium]|nr:hypothetical protein [bacterium]
MQTTQAVVSGDQFLGELEFGITWDPSRMEESKTYFGLLIEGAGDQGILASEAQELMKKEGLWPDVGPKAGAVVRSYAVKDVRDEGVFYIPKASKSTQVVESVGEAAVSTGDPASTVEAAAKVAAESVEEKSAAESVKEEIGSKTPTPELDYMLALVEGLESRVHELEQVNNALTEMFELLEAKVISGLSRLEVELDLSMVKGDPQPKKHVVHLHFHDE